MSNVKQLRKEHEAAKSAITEATATRDSMRQYIAARREEQAELFERRKRAEAAIEETIKRHAAGTVTDEDIEQARRALADIESKTASLEQQIHVTEDSVQRLDDEIGIGLVNRRRVARAALFAAVRDEAAQNAVRAAIGELAVVCSAQFLRIEGGVGNVDGMIDHCLREFLKPEVKKRLTTCVEQMRAEYGAAG